MQTVANLEPSLVGVCGEYLVAAELSKRGYLATITLRNSRGIDILVAKSDASYVASIQVKANKTRKKDWMLSEKCDNYSAEHLFYVFVNIGEVGEHSEFHIVPSKIVADTIRTDHQKWLERPSKSGAVRSGTSVRHFKDSNCTYLDRWDLLKLD